MLRNATVLKSLAMTVAILAGSLSLFAQPANYTVVPSLGTYQPISGGTLWASGTALDDQSVTGVSIGFNFVYGSGITVSTVNVNANGYISFGSAPAGNVYTPLSSTAVSDQIVAAFARDLIGRTTGSLRTQLLGTSPNRVFVIQWADVTRKNSQYDSYNFQIRLNETTNTIDVVYGTVVVNGTLGAQIGMRGSSNALVHSIRADYDENTWTLPRVFTTSPARESVLEENFVPASGQTYRWSRRTITNDICVLNIEGPTGNFNANTSQTVTARIRNCGTNVVDSFIVDWKVNGQLRTAVTYYGAVAANAEVVVTLGTVNFGDRTWNRIEARTLAPNGVADALPGNDGAEAYRAPRVSGTFAIAKVGANAGVFTSFRDFYRHLKVAGINGNVTANVHAGVYNEPLVLDGVSSTDASQRITFQANSGDEVVMEYPLHNDRATNNYGSYEFPAIVNMLAGTNTTIEGIHFRVQAGSQFQGGVLILGSLQNMVMRNCRFTGLTSNTISGAALEMSVPSATNITLDNLIVTNHRLGVLLVPTSFSNISITNGQYSCSAGIQIQGNGSGLVIRNNRVVVENVYTGINPAIGVFQTTSPTIENNVVDGTLALQGLNGITVNHDFGTATVVNNMVSAAGTTQAIAFWVDARNNTSTNFYHNTANVTAPSTAASAGLYVNNNENLYPNFTVNSVNNILHNFGLGTNGGPALWIAEPSGVLPTPANTPMQISDFNNIVSTGSFPVRVINTAYTTLAAYRTAFARELNSSSVPVTFVGLTDLHLLTIQPQLFGASSITPQVPRDIDGEQRVKPYMGADEIFPKARFVQQPQSRYVCYGESLTLVAVAEVTLGATTKYQWYKDGAKLLGRTSAIMTINNTAYDAAAVYHCEVEVSDGTTTITVRSDEATIMVVRPTSIVEHPASQPVALGSTVNLHVEAEAVGTQTSLSPTYQWKKRYWNPVNRVYQDSVLNDNGRITGTRSSILTIRNLNAGDTTDTYFCTVTGFCGTADSKVARLFIPRVIVADNIPSACIGQPIQMEVGATPGSGNGLTLSYQWYRNGNPLTNDARITGANGKVLVVNNTTAGDNGDYHCVVTYGPMDAAVPSNTITVELGIAPVITSQPVAAEICEGGDILLASQATGSNLAFQWVKNGVNVPGAAGASLNIQNATVTDAGTYNVVVTNSCGQVTSVTVEIAVNTKPSISQQPRDQTVNAGDAINLSVAATGTGTMAYQWFRNGEKIDNATGATYQVTNAAATDAGVYTVEVTNDCGKATSEAAVVDVATSVAGDVYVNGFMLGNAVPNPASGAVSFSYEMASTQNVRIVLMDMLGRPIANIVDGIVEAGRHTAMFNVADLGLNAGVYMYTLQTNGVNATQQVVVVR